MVEYNKAVRLLSAKIRKLRRRKRLTREKLAYENDISKGNLSDIENGKHSPNLQTLISLANGLGCRVKDLIDF